MGLLKGNYELEDEVQVSGEEIADDKLLEQEYYKAALEKLGGSIAFIMKGKTFLWTGDEVSPSASAGDNDENLKNASSEDIPSATKVNRDE